MWLLLAITSALLLGFYDIFKKISVAGNNVLTVLFLNTLFSALIFVPIIILSVWGGQGAVSPDFYIPLGTFTDHLKLMVKAAIVLTSWILGYFSLKHLPLTIVGPINASRPVMVLLGAILIFGERLNIYQWAGVIVAIISFFMLSITGRKEGIKFGSNKWILYCVGATVMGGISALFDRYLTHEYVPMFVLSWYTIYQFIFMGSVLLILSRLQREERTKFQWRWSIPLISIFIIAADFAYFRCLSDENSMISIVSLIRRSSVMVSFFYGAFVLREKNIKGKIVDLALMLVGLILLVLGSI